MKDTKEETRQKLPEFTAEASLGSTTSQRYHFFSRASTLTARLTIILAASFLDYPCYYKCMKECKMYWRLLPRMWMVSCPKKCRAQCGPLA
jgi:hypothetical protein